MKLNDRVDMGKLFKLYGDIHKDMKAHQDKETSDKIGDSIIMSAYRQIPLEKLLRIQFLLGKIIKEKKELKYIRESDKNADRPKDDSKSDDNRDAGDTPNSPIGSPDTSIIH